MPVILNHCRTDTSDCCPDYFTHCEGLRADNPYATAPKELNAYNTPSFETYLEQTAPVVETVFGPSICPYGTRSASGKIIVHFATSHSFKSPK